MCLVLLVSLADSAMSAAAFESSPSGMVSGWSGSRFSISLYIFRINAVAIMHSAAVQYSASPTELAMSLGTGADASTTPPCSMITYPPVDLFVSGQSWNDESDAAIMGYSHTQSHWISRSFWCRGDLVGSE